MTYQFKYLEVQDSRREQGGGGFKVIKLFLELVVLVAVMAYAFQVYSDKKSQSALSEITPAQIAQGSQAGLLQNVGITPDAKMLEEAQTMAQQFIASGDMSEFEKQARSQNIGLDF